MSNDVVALGSSSSASQFPAGLRILLVDDCQCSLSILKMMLKKCNYRVTTCSSGKDALTLLQDRKDGFDLVLTDVHIPEMDGIQLLTAITPEMDVPVVLISSDLRPQTVIKAMKNGACDYLDKPGRMEQYKNLWQHVFRKKVKKENRKRSRRDAEETESEETAAKKLRVKWTPDLHQKFIAAVNYLGIDKAVPKRVLELMDISTLTKENIASHLQKFRVFLKKYEHQQPGRISPETLAAVSSFTLNSANFGNRPLTRNGISKREPSRIAIQEAPQQLNQQSPHPLPGIPETSPLPHQESPQLNLHPSRLLPVIPKNSPVAAQQSPHLLNSQPSRNLPLNSQPTRIRPIVRVHSPIALQESHNPLNLRFSRIISNRSPQTFQVPVQTQAQASLQTMSSPLLVNQNSVSALSQSMGFYQEGGIPQQPLSNYWTMNNYVHTNHANNIHVSVVQNPNYTVSRELISVEGRNNVSNLQNYQNKNCGLVSLVEFETSDQGQTRNHGFVGESHDNDRMMQYYQNRGSVSLVEIETSDQGKARIHGLVGESGHSQTAGNNLGVNGDIGGGDYLSDYFDIPTDDWGPNN